jgi:hypothetical protein
MAKQGNPLLRKTAPVEPEIIDDGADIIPFNETFPGVPPMSVREKKRLTELETVVTTNFKAFYEVGSALREISNSLLYRETHTTFADYVKDLWDMARCRAYQMIDAADIVDRLIPFSPEIEMSTNGRQNGDAQNFGQTKLVPQNERQARALAKYPEEKQIEIWRQALKTADGRITAAHIKKTARQIHGKIVKDKIQKTRKKTTSPAVQMSDRFRAAFNELLDAINEERMADWQNTDRDEVLRHLQGLAQAIAAPL